MAVKHATKVDEPVKDLLCGIESGLISQLSQSLSHSVLPLDVTSTLLPLPQKVDVSVDEIASSYGVLVVSVNDSAVFSIEQQDSLISVDDWLRILADKCKDSEWLLACLLSKTVVQEKMFVENPFRRILAPRPKLKLTLTGSGNTAKLSTADVSVEVSYNSALQQVALTLVENGVALPFLFQFQSATPFAYLHEVMEGRNLRIKEFYHRLWFGESIDILPSIHDLFTCTGRVEGQSIQSFCSVVQNYCPSFIGQQAPMDFAIVLGWKAIIRTLFSKEIDGDLLRLVHLSNGFRVLDQERPLLVGDLVVTEAKVASVSISDAGKTVKVVGQLIRAGAPVLEVTSEFLFRGSYKDFSNCFHKVQEDLYVLDVATKKDYSVLLSKSWFSFDEPQQSNSFASGLSSLIFRLKTFTEYADESTIGRLHCSGSVFVVNRAQGEVKVGQVDYEGKNVKGNPVLSYLKRHGSFLSKQSPLDNEYEVRIEDSLSPAFSSPVANNDYALISGDTNPIHVNPYFAAVAHLPATITHGMWTSAATRKYLDVVAAGNDASLVLSYKVQFVGMVCPSDKLSVRLVHTAMNNGAKVFKVETTNQRGERVLDGVAEVLQPPTAFVFTGQGSQEQGMGMDLFSSSEVARAVWEKADSYLQETYSFSIIDIVKNNPKQKTVHFGGLQGQKVRERYMAMTYDSVDSDGNLKSIALFPDITVASMKYTFYSPTGLLFSTQFAQIALVVTEKAAFEDMKAKGLVGKNVSAFAGHSLGEYAALAAVADFLSINSLCDIVFYRGLTMQRAVERDSQNRSNYAMCAVNPSRVGKTFTEEALKHIVKSVSSLLPGLCEIVNYNVENQQYVVAGELIALEALGNVLNFMKIQNIDLVEIAKVLSMEEVDAKLQLIVQDCLEKAKAKKEELSFLELQRGYATIPLPGIDIPFHSSHIWSGVGPFRSFISRKIDRHQLNVDLLIGKYIPNLTAAPFSLEKSYIQGIFDQTASPRLGKILESWKVGNWTTPAKKQQLGYTILVELLAYQFASPVRWIETQDQLFSSLDICRVIEVGPSPVLTGMAVRTLKSKYEAKDTATSVTRQTLCVSKNTKEIYYQYDVATPIESPSEPSLPAVSASSVAPAADPIHVPRSPMVATAEPVSDTPVTAVQILVAIIAQKLKKAAPELLLTKSIKDLVAGKSTLQNEILGDLQNEFSSAPEKAEELPLEELGAVLASQHNGTLGKQMSSMISRLINQKFPGGFPLSSVRGHLSKAWGLGNGRVDSVLVRGLTNEPPSRLSSEAEAKAWLDSVTLMYAKENGVSLQQGVASANGASTSGPVMNSEEFDKYRAAQDSFVAQHVELYMRYLGKSSRGGDNMYLEEKARNLDLQRKLDEIYEEHGERYIKGIRPVFTAQKARMYDSFWNWVRQDAIEM